MNVYLSCTVARLLYQKKDKGGYNDTVSSAIPTEGWTAYLPIFLLIRQ